MKYTELYSKIEKPSYYLGNEINSVNKENIKTDLRFLLAFPDMYEIGSSHFGMQILYDILNKRENIAAERVFVPLPDMREELEKNEMNLLSLESKSELKSFDIIGFSLLYELNYTGILEILDLSGIPFYSKDRDDSYPLVIAGGPCMVNPEPVADFFDLMLVGDGEEAIIEISEKYIECQNNNLSKRDTLLSMKNIEGVYIPSFFEDEGEGTFNKPLLNDYVKVKKRVVKDLETAEFPLSPVIPFGRPVHDRLRLEISRGCSRGCRFCQAGMIYRPVRERSVEKLIEITEESIKNTGYEDISLLSLSTGDYSCFSDLLTILMNKYQKEARAISLPSIRAGRLTSSLMNEIKKVRKTGFTIAPEAGSQRLRDVINKDLSEDVIVNTVQSAFEMGWSLIKLYFMTGLPTETKDDLDELIKLVKKLKNSSPSRKAKITVSITTFIPKSHTPFQWERQISMEESMEKFLYIKNNLKMNGISVKWQDPEHSRLEGLFARGGRFLSSLIVRAYKKGCHLDGWNEYFNYNSWVEAIEEENIDVDYYLRKRDDDEPLPWDKIDIGIPKKYFINEFEKALKEEITRDCRIDKCSGCGVCDFKKISPKLFKENEYPLSETPIEEEKDIKRFKIEFKKYGKSRFLGHLELISVFMRALDRSGMKFEFSKGFHPKPQIKFNDALPVGIQSFCEYFTVLSEDIDNDELIKNLNINLPEGVEVSNIEKYEKSHKILKNPVVYAHYILDYDFSSFEKNIDDFLKEDKHEITLIKKGKERIYDLKYWFKNIEIIENNKIYMKILSENGKTLRPDIFLTHIMNFNKESIKDIIISKIKESSSV